MVTGFQKNKEKQQILLRFISLQMLLCYLLLVKASHKGRGNRVGLLLRGWRGTWVCGAVKGGWHHLSR